MDALLTCGRCGAALTADGPEGLCAKCMLQDGLLLGDNAPETAAPPFVKGPEIEKSADDVHNLNAG